MLKKENMTNCALYHTMLVPGYNNNNVINKKGQQKIWKPTSA